MAKQNIARVNREDILVHAEGLFQRAKDGIAKRRNQKSKRIIGLTKLLVNSPSLYVQEEIKLFIDAAEAFRICSKWIDAAEAYSQGAWMLGHDLNEYEAGAVLYTEAGICEMRFGMNQGEKHFKQAISLYCTCEKFDQAGRIRQWIAKSYEESNCYHLAIDEYKLAAKYFEAMNMTEKVLNCELKNAHLLSLSGNYEEASKLYRSIGNKELLGNLTKYSAHKSFFRSSLFFMSEIMKSGQPYDFDKVCNYIKKLSETNFRFEVSPSCDFLHNIIHLMKDKNCKLDEFVDHLYDYNSLYPLDKSCLEVLENIMQHRFQEQMDQIRTSVTS